MDFESQKAKILKAARSNIPITIKTYTLPRETEMQLEEVLRFFLAEVGQDHLIDHLSYCLRELTVNAKKANTKRVYFEEKGFNIEDPASYEKGIKGFKDETLSNISYWLEKQKKAGYYIKVQFHHQTDALRIAIKNNVAINRKEENRIKERIAKSRSYDSMEDAFTEILDDSEGAGLGIVIMILMLKKMGLNEDAFAIAAINGETIATLHIPFNEVRLEDLDSLSQTIVDEIHNLPPFPANILEIQKLIADPESKINTIAKHISVDPSLTADLLRLVNSAQYVLAKKVENIMEAVKIVGLKGLKNLLYSYGTQLVLGKDTPEQEALWEHCYRTATFAYLLAKYFKRKRDLMDDVYVGGILHDMGKIVFSNVHPQLLEKIQQFNDERQLPFNAIEELTAGLNHQEIGARIAEKWNFPSILVEAIRYHHEPDKCSPEHRDHVYIVYLANVLTHYEAKELGFEQLEPRVLKYFNIATEMELYNILDQLKSDFNEDII
ncbi:HDOD domain-containing protein [Spirochaeta cellobiosiphila]|uniref:HDOD domain-containing protein n=1 Tax=Spirochaeta cellobiosiphila TaxID=504483 RepID=UPI0003FBC350|nr:HDOD domain-containing protein [Spirochaeta cellobiosiphila]